MKAVERDIKIKSVEIIKENNNSKLETLESLNYKIGILLGFFFLIFFESLKFLNDAGIIYKFSNVFLILLSIFFLTRSFFLAKVNSLYPNVDNVINYDGIFKWDWFLEHRYEDYKEIGESVEGLIKSRENDFKYGLLLFLFSFIPVIIYFLS